MMGRFIPPLRVTRAFLRAAQRPCSAIGCNAPSTALCDARTTELTRCDLRVCERHRVRMTDNTDRCLEHAPAHLSFHGTVTIGSDGAITTTPDTSE